MKSIISHFSSVILGFAVLIAGSSAQAQLSCQEAYSITSQLADTYYSQGILGDLDHLGLAVQGLSSAASSLSNIGQEAQGLNQLHVGATINSMMSQNVRANINDAYNNNVNAQNILNGALQKYEAILNDANLADVVSHIKNALNSAQATQTYIMQSQAADDSVRAKANQLDQQISGSAQRIGNIVAGQISSLSGSSRTIQQMSANLVGQSYYWGSHNPDAYSKIGRLKQASDYLSRNACIKTP